MAFLPDSHRYFGTCLDERQGESRVGGTISAIRQDIARKAFDIKVSIHQRGRILTVSLWFDVWKHFTAIHINLAMTLGVQKQTLSMLHARLARLAGSHSLLGDWNFMHMGDARATERGEDIFSADEVAVHFERTFTNYAELYQREYTFARAMRALHSRASMSRIDRMYTDLPQTSLEKYNIQVAVVGPLLEAHPPSDHRAVRAIFSMGMQTGRRTRVPKHVAESPEFQAILAEMLADYGQEQEQTTWARVESLITSAHRAARAARPLLVAKDSASPRLLAQTLLSALRLNRDGAHDKAVRMLEDIPKFAACVSGGTLQESLIQHRIRQYME